MSFVNQDEIFKATDGGLDIILHYYPQGANCVNNAKKFKVRDTEKTASCTIKKMPDGNYVVTDFGGDGKPRNAIAVVMYEANVDFKTAIQLIAEKWNILPEEKKTEILKPDVKQRDAAAEEEEGVWSFEFGDYTERDLKAIFADQVIKYTQDKCNNEQGTKKEDWIKKLSKLCESYYMYKCTSYSIVKERRVTTISSTEHYPIFVFEIPLDGGRKIRKIYQPLSPDKGRRFIYEPGKRPDDHIFGLSQAIKKYESLNEKVTDDLDEDGNPVKAAEVKLTEIIMCTGGSDALNVAAIGYQVVWFNSETAKVTGAQYYNISKYAEKLCMLPDIDPTGKRAAHEFCMIYLETRTIVLPKELADKRDWRGNSCKDIRDYLRFWKPKDFDKLVEAALPYKFWDEVPQYNKQGKKVGINYDCNNTHLYWFLGQNGFYQFTNKNETDIYIHIVGNIVTEVDTKKIRKYINAFLSERNVETKLRNTFYRTTQLNASSFENLPHITVDFNDFDKETQWLFFNNQTWQIKKDGITRYKPGEIFKYVWNKEVINHRVELLEDFFKIEQDGFGGWKIDVTNNDCIFFRFIQRTCQMHWRVEELGVDDGQGGLRKKLTDEEKREHDHHLINKIYALGYLLHKYKEPSSAYAVWAMENEVIEDGASEGRTGKSILLKFPRFFMKHEVIAARDQRITENKHMLENVNEFTSYVLFDDCSPYLNFSFFFPLITGPWTINPKNTKSFGLSEEDAPKISFSSNFAPRDADSSTLDRLIFCVFSDYYHAGPSEKYPERRTPKEEFKMNLFTDFTEDEWNRTLNFGAQCIKAFLSIDEKINPPMNKVTQRHLLGDMGQVFKAWADVYFSVESGRLNSMVVRSEAFEDCRKKNNLSWSAQKFGSALKSWCKFYGYPLNPKDKCNSNGNRIIQRVMDKAEEMIYIEANPTTIEMAKLPQVGQVNIKLDEKVIEEKAKEAQDDLPF
jgi:hypothetical protein